MSTEEHFICLSAGTPSYGSFSTRALQSAYTFGIVSHGLTETPEHSLLRNLQSVEKDYVVACAKLVIYVFDGHLISESPGKSGKSIRLFE